MSDGGLAVRYTFLEGSAVGVEMTYQPGQQEEKPLLPRFGMSFTAPGELDKATWYGRGPFETYWDRKSGGEVGIYSLPVDEMWFPYVRVQDTGNRADVRWFVLVDEKGEGLKVEAAEGGEPLNFSVLPFALTDLWEATHPYELKKREVNSVFIDAQLHGVGGDNSWGARTHAEYTMPGNRAYSLRFVIGPVLKR